MRFVGAAAIGVLIAAFLAWKFFALVIVAAIVVGLAKALLIGDRKGEGHEEE